MRCWTASSAGGTGAFGRAHGVPVHHGTRSGAARGADLFTGDTLFFGGRIVLQSIWDCDLRSHLESLRRLAEHRFNGLFPGHLTFTVTDGERHLRIALDAIDRGGIPPLL